MALEALDYGEYTVSSTGTVYFRLQNSDSDEEKSLIVSPSELPIMMRAFAEAMTRFHADRLRETTIAAARIRDGN